MSLSYVRNLFYLGVEPEENWGIVVINRAQISHYAELGKTKSKGLYLLHDPENASK